MCNYSYKSISYAMRCHYNVMSKCYEFFKGGLGDLFQSVVSVVFTGFIWSKFKVHNYPCYGLH